MCFQNPGLTVKILRSRPAVQIKVLSWWHTHGEYIKVTFAIVLLIGMNWLLGYLWATRTSWEWWDEWNDTALHTQDSKLELWRSGVEHATSPSRMLPTILNLYEWTGKKHIFFKTWIITSEQGWNILFLRNLNARVGFKPAFTDFPSRQL